MGLELKQSTRTSDWWWAAHTEPGHGRPRITADSGEGYRNRADCLNGAAVTLEILLRSPDLPVDHIVDAYLAERGEYRTRPITKPTEGDATGEPMVEVEVDTLS